MLGVPRPACDGGQGSWFATDDLLKITLYVGDPHDLALFEAVRAHFIADAALPAFECIAVFAPGPVPDALVQIEAIGAKN